MNQIIFYLIIFSFLIESDYSIISSYSSEYNGLYIDKSNLKDIEIKYGKDYKLESYSYHINYRTKENTYITFHKVYYVDIGIKFIIFNDKPNKGKINKIIFSEPFKDATDKGIVIGKSTFKDVEAVYGEGYWNNGSVFYSRKATISYERISFKTDKTIDVENLENRKLLANSIVTEIELSGKRD